MTELEIKATVRERDGDACVDCGTTGRTNMANVGMILDVHRLVPGSPYTIDGCVTVCKRCHGERHVGSCRKRSGKSLTTALNFNSETCKMIKIIAIWNGTTVNGYISGIVRPVIEKAFTSISLKHNS